MHALVPVSLLGSIPSPSFNTLELGPITLRIYGLCIALGVIAAVLISSKRWEARGGDPDDIAGIALWAVPAGVIGARLYHVATDWRTYQDRWLDAFKITNGGLGIPGGIGLGVIVGIIYVKRKGLPVRDLLDVVAPAIPVAQAIGRLGNWFNQELFGRVTSLPWALKVDPEKAAELGFPAGTTFHPTFLYEALWNLALAGILVLIDRTKKLRPGELFTIYVLGYAIGRLWVEELRIDKASLIAGVRVNIWMSILAALLAVTFFVWNRTRTSDIAVVTAGDDAEGTVADDDLDADGAMVSGGTETETEDAPVVDDEPPAEAEAEADPDPEDDPEAAPTETPPT